MSGIAKVIHPYVREQGLGEVFFAPCDAVQPDLLFVSHERAPLLLGGANVLGAPDLVVEIYWTYK